MKKRFLSFFQTLLWGAIAVVIVAVIATGIMTNITLRSVEKNLPNALFEQLHDLNHVLEDHKDVVSAAELTQAVPNSENIAQLRNKVMAVYKGTVELRNTYVFDNLIQASSFHAVVAPAITDAQIWLSEGVSGYGPETVTTIKIVRARIFEAFQKARVLNNDSHLKAQRILNNQRNRLDRFLFGVNLLFVLTLVISLIMVLLLIRQQVLQRREVQAQDQRRRAEESLRVSEQRFRQLAEATSEAVVIHDQGIIIEANDQYYKMFGYSPDELGGIDAIALTATKDSADQMRKHIISGHLGPYEATGKRKDGSTFPVEIRVKTIDISGKAIRMSAIRDLTGRKKYEEALRNSEEQLKSYLNSNPNPVVVYNLQGHPLYLNPAFTRVFGWLLEELHGEKIPFVPPDQEQITAEKIKTLFQSQKPIIFNTRRLTKDGDIRDILISAAEIKGPGKGPAGMVVNLVDITETKKLESQFQAAQRIESLGTLAGGIAHDFNNLLMGILGNVTLMLDEKSTSSADYDKLKSIEQYVRDGSHLTQQLLGFAKGGKYEVKPLNINALIEKSTRMFGRTKKEIHIHQNYQEDVWIVEADPGQMEQVLLNLFVNAWQAMPGGGELYLETANVNLDEDFSRPFKLKPGKYVKISITDTGIGMDEPTRERIFHPFFTTKEMGRGTGLGLASVYGIIKNHDGLIDVYSQKGEGASFHIYLPASDKKIIADQTLTQETLPGSGTILLVDDEKMIVTVGRKMLERLGYDVISASNGKEALELYRQNKRKIKLVILDMIMPDMDGGQVYDQLKQINPDVKTILSSGYSINGKATEILERGCKGFIQKPFNLNELSIKLNEVME